MTLRAEKSVKSEEFSLRAGTAKLAKTPVAKQTHGACKIKGAKEKGQIGGPYGAIGCAD